MEKVVKCNEDKCGQHFMLTKKDKECPFCHTKYVEVEGKTSSKGGPTSGGKEKKGATKTQEGSFKIWKNN